MPRSGAFVRPAWPGLMLLVLIVALYVRPARPQGPVRGKGVLINSIGMKLVPIPAGEFVMGSPDGEENTGNDEHPQHRVQITRPIYLGVYEVTQSQYKTVMGVNPSWFSPSGRGKDEVAGLSTNGHPVERVSWLDAVTFCNRLSEREGRKPFYEIDGERVRVPDWNGRGYRLPTEAEWEYACRGGTHTRYALGEDETSLGEYAWFSWNSGGPTGPDTRRTHPVGEKRPNRFGLFDMQGNVLELCWDGYEKGYYGAAPLSDPHGPDGTSERVNRGGSWLDPPWDCRPANRSWIGPDHRSDSVGFRVAAGQPGR